MNLPVSTTWAWRDSPASTLAAEWRRNTCSGAGALAWQMADEECPAPVGLTGTTCGSASRRMVSLPVPSANSYACCVAPPVALAGMIASGETLHDHADGSFHMSRADNSLTGMDSVGHPIWINGEDVDYLSSADFQAGPATLPRRTVSSARMTAVRRRG